MDVRLTRHPLGYWEISEKPGHDELKFYYAQKYFQESRGGYEHNYDNAELEFLRAKLEQRWHLLRRITGAKLVTDTSRMLDIGCGEGFALAFFRAKGWQVKGIDFSSSGLESKNPSCRDALVVGDVFELLKYEIASGQKYQVVWLQNVLEHVLDPIELLSSLRRLGKL